MIKIRMRMTNGEKINKDLAPTSLRAVFRELKTANKSKKIKSLVIKFEEDVTPAYDRTEAKKKFNQCYTEIGVIGDPCHYCGQRANTFDHVPPLRYADLSKDPFLKVPCCSQCNMILGDSLTLDLEERKSYVAQVLKLKSLQSEIERTSAAARLDPILDEIAKELDPTYSPRQPETKKSSVPFEMIINRTIEASVVEHISETKPEPEIRIEPKLELKPDTRPDEAILLAKAIAAIEKFRMSGKVESSGISDLEALESAERQYKNFEGFGERFKERLVRGERLLREQFP